MGYNNGLAVGLSVGIPCFLILVLCVAFYIRNRKRQRKEDNMEQDIDVELRDDNSFNRFQDALHKQQSGNYDKKEGSDVGAHEKQVLSTDLDVHDDNISLSRGLSASNAFSEQKRANFFTPPPSVLNGNSARYVPNSASHSPGFPGAHQKSSSAYDVYDTFIPILASHNSTAGDLSDLTHPPPALNPDGKSSASSSNTSLIGGSGSPVTATGANRENHTTNQNNSRSLENLAKQLHLSQLFDKLPSRAATVTTRHRPHVPVPNNNSSTELVKDYFRNDAINENYIVQVPTAHDDDDEDEDEGLTPRPKHLYFQRVIGSTSDEDTKENALTVQQEEVDTPMSETAPEPKRPSGISNIEGNFDNNIATDRFDDDEPDVVFK